MSAPPVPPPPVNETRHWTTRQGKPIVFVILTLVAVGIYLALTIPVAVFPETEFPRIVVGVDNGVAPIDRMLVTVTRPIEEAAQITAVTVVAEWHLVPIRQPTATDGS